MATERANEIRASAEIEMVDPSGAKGATSSKPGASPQVYERIETSAESALNPTDLPSDSTQLSGNELRLQRDGWCCTNPGALPQAANEGSAFGAEDTQRADVLQRGSERDKNSAL
jgi:hypothetical protein